jgi:hypothetical protein
MDMFGRQPATAHTALTEKKKKYLFSFSGSAKFLTDVGIAIQLFAVW